MGRCYGHLLQGELRHPQPAPLAPTLGPSLSSVGLEESFCPQKPSVLPSSTEKQGLDKCSAVSLNCLQVQNTSLLSPWSPDS